VSAAQVEGDPDELTRVIRNLLDNASRHARTSVRVALAEDDGHVTLTVADDGPGIASTDADRIFERFVRVDEARHGGDGGSGLGLAIARELVERNGGTIGLDTTFSPGARFVVQLPNRSRA
jgi:signal transduction histidine kinase